MPKLIVTLLATLLLASCGGRQQVYERPPGSEAAERGVTLPPPVPATPVFVVTTRGGLSARLAKTVAGLKGVAVLAPMSIRKMKVSGPQGSARLRVGAVEPLRFRSVAPASTRDAEFVWVSLVVGGAVPSFDAADRLGLQGSTELTIGGTPGFEVTAYADNGVPNLADVLVQNGAERQLDMPRPSTFVVGARSGVTIEALRSDLRRALPRSARITRLIPKEHTTAPSAPAAPAPVGHVSGGVVGSMTFQVLESGFIRPDPSWVASNIVQATVPLLGGVRCHRLMVPRLQGALQEVEDRGLANLIRPGDYGGCYVPRFIDRNPANPLSMHAFGLAVDLNVSTNGLGTRGDMDPRIVEIFGRWGFTWGGTWGRPDPMHFEL